MKKEIFSFNSSMEDWGGAFLCVDTLKNTSASSLFQSLLQVADTNTLSLEGGGMYFVIVGIRTTGISIAGKDER